MAQATTPTKTLYPFNEGFRVQTNGTTAVTFWTIPANSVVTRVFVKTVTAGSGSTTNYVAIGDASDADGLIAGFDPNATAGTFIGDATAELGVYMFSTDYLIKDYTTATALKAVCEVTTNTTDPVFDVFVIGYHYGEAVGSTV